MYIGYYMFTCCIFIPQKWQRWSHVTSKSCGGALVVAGVESTLHWKLFHFMWHVPFPEARCSRSRWCFQIFSMFHPKKDVKRSIFRLAHIFVWEPVAKIPPRRAKESGNARRAETEVRKRISGQVTALATSDVGWRFVRSQDKPMHGSCFLIYSSGVLVTWNLKRLSESRSNLKRKVPCKIFRRGVGDSSKKGAHKKRAYLCWEGFEWNPGVLSKDSCSIY